METLGLYVDVENLQDSAKQAIQSTFEQWPEEFPKPTKLRLYVRADQTELRYIWASNEFPTLDVKIKGVQHYTLKGSKNSAVISISLDSLADLLRDRIAHVAILSDGSDFASLFATIKQETESSNFQKIPFIWFVTDRPGTRSSTLSDFLPTDYLRMLSFSDMRDTLTGENERPGESHLSEEDQIALQIVRHVPVGQFKSTDCKRRIAHYFPQHSLANADSPTFGVQFAKAIWPKLEGYSVRIPNPDKKSRRYEMTETVKAKVETTMNT